MSLKDGKKGVGGRGGGTNERIAVGSGERRGVSAKGWWKCARGGSVKEKEVGEGCTAGGSLFLCLLRL